MDKYVEEYEQRTDVTGSSKTKVRSAIANRLGRLRNIELEVIEPKTAINPAECRSHLE